MVLKKGKDRPESFRHERDAIHLDKPVTAAKPGNERDTNHREMVPVAQSLPEHLKSRGRVLAFNKIHILFDRVGKASRLHQAFRIIVLDYSWFHLSLASFFISVNDPTPNPFFGRVLFQP